MSIRPVVLNGMIQTTQEGSIQKQNENNRPVFQQQAMQVQSMKETTHHMQKVNNPDDTENPEYKYDARKEGKNKYEDGRKKKKSKKETLQGDGKVTPKMPHGGFDISI
ncbi:hypothetical protein LQZ18_06445 [Lachnospiraceae bacterium ZAX-1]